MRNEERGARSEKNEEGSKLDPALLQRVRWRSRRGLLELDIVLGRFIEAHYAQLSEKEKQAFEALLDMPDNPLWDMIVGRAERGVQEATQGEQQALLEKIRAV
jgi:antitoxin CptB